MGNYINELNSKAETLSLEDDEYEGNLLEIAKLFKDFGNALTLFLTQYGFCNEQLDNRGRINYIRTQFSKHDMKVPRGLGSWFESGKKIERKTAYQFCFALELSVELTNTFFATVMFERGIDCHVIEEAVYCFALKNHYSYQQAIEWINQIPQVKKSVFIPNRDVLYTKTILEYVNSIDNPEDLIHYITDHISDFTYNNATAISFIQKLWQQIVGDHGLANQEGQLIARKIPDLRSNLISVSTNELTENKYDPDVPVTANSNASTWTIFAQIIGLDYFQEDIVARRYDRSLSPILQKNVLMPLNASYCFPNQHAIDRLFRGEIASNELVRKMLIFLVFYTYWVKKIISAEDVDYPANYKDSERCLYTINKYLTDAGYAELYAGNPYDWLFKWALNDRHPLMAFRYYMGEVFAQNPL